MFIFCENMDFFHNFLCSIGLSMTVSQAASLLKFLAVLFLVVS
jgi:hypothetical protein